MVQKYYSTKGKFKTKEGKGKKFLSKSRVPRNRSARENESSYIV